MDTCANKSMMFRRWSSTDDENLPRDCCDLFLSLRSVEGQKDDDRCADDKFDGSTHIGGDTLEESTPVSNMAEQDSIEDTKTMNWTMVMMSDDNSHIDGNRQGNSNAMIPTENLHIWFVHIRDERHAWGEVRRPCYGMDSRWAWLQMFDRCWNYRWVRELISRIEQRKRTKHW